MDENVTVPRKLLEKLTDTDDCMLDHDGGCQEHHFFSLRQGDLCPQEELKRRLRGEM